MHETSHIERAVLVALEVEDLGDTLEARLDELEELANTAGVTVVRKVGQRRKMADPAYLIGHGKADELAGEVKDAGAELVLFDDELSPTQQRNLGEALNARVLDRTQLILDIFAQRARTREGKLQVELAQMMYLLPRIGSLYTKFERQQGVSESGEGVVKPNSNWISARFVSVSPNWNENWTKFAKAVGSNVMPGASCPFLPPHWSGIHRQGNLLCSTRFRGRMY